MFLFVRIRLLNLNIMKPMEAESVQDESLHNFATLNLEFIFFLFEKRNDGISTNREKRSLAMK